MWCYQCEQTARGSGCTAFGACGKDPDTAALQDLLLYATQGIAHYAHRARRLGAVDAAVDRFVVEALFTTVTNVNFDPERVAGLVRDAASLRDRARSLYEQACAEKGEAPRLSSVKAAEFRPADGIEEMIRQGEAATIERRGDTLGEDVTGLQELIVYGLKGMAAYADHALVLGKEDPEALAFFHEALDFVAREPTDMKALLTMALRCGEANLRVMQWLDQAHGEAFGAPSPARVRVTPVRGKAILVSGHDLKDLDRLLHQTKGTGIRVYTHGEMLPAHGYPGLRKHPHLAGNYGGAWQDQRNEFDDFPGAILMTTNCIQKPKDSYKRRLFTSGLVAWPGVPHIADGNFAPLIEAAQAAPGFDKDGEDRTILVGFGHQAVLAMADRVVAAVRKGALRHFFLIGGCDGAKSGRNYYTDFARAVPEDCVILTLACGKYRFNKLDFGTCEDIPRLLDCGQCNDAYSAIRIASGLAEALGCSLQDLPLSLVLSWYEQKAVGILLSLLHLGIRNIRLGPSLPAFITPAVLNVLVERFGIKPITTPEEDLKTILSD